MRVISDVRSLRRPAWERGGIGSPDCAGRGMGIVQEGDFRHWISGADDLDRSGTRRIPGMYSSQLDHSLKAAAGADSFDPKRHKPCHDMLIVLHSNPLSRATTRLPLPHHDHGEVELIRQAQQGLFCYCRLREYS